MQPMVLSVHRGWQHSLEVTSESDAQLPSISGKDRHLSPKSS